MSNKQYLVDSARRGRRTHLIKVMEESTTRDYGKALGAGLVTLVPVSTIAASVGVMVNSPGTTLSISGTVLAAVAVLVLSLFSSFGMAEVMWHLRDRSRTNTSTYESFLGLAWRPVGLKGTRPSRWWQRKNGHISATLNDQLAERFADHDETGLWEWKTW